MGLPDCLSVATTKFNTWINNKVTLDPDVKNTVYYYGLASSKTPEAHWNELWKKYLAETDAQEKTKLMSALSAVQVPWILQRYIYICL